MISVIVSSYKRPWNLDKLIPHLKNNKLISEIIILHGHQDHVKHFDGCRNIDDWENNKKLFTLCRFNAASLASNEIVLLNDDDFFLSEEFVIKMFDIYQEDTLGFYGTMFRKCNCDGYFLWPKDKNIKDYNIVLPNSSIASKEVYMNVFKNMRIPKYTELFEKVITQQGGCEDLFFNRVYADIYQKKPVFVAPWIKGELQKHTLDKKSGFCSRPEHKTERKEFCKKYFCNNINLK